MKVYKALLCYLNVNEGVLMYMRQYDVIWKYMIVFECKW